ncbi:hypothetical protein SLE2022_214140 [Rubroshorea leprosula]
MASSSPLTLLLIISILLTVNAQVDHATSFQLMNEANEWSWGMSREDELVSSNEDEENGDIARRSLYWKPMHYYISYGALSANRVPCPPRSGRSYYTNNCFRAHGPVHPYTRGCSRITLCRR